MELNLPAGTLIGIGAEAQPVRWSDDDTAEVPLPIRHPMLFRFSSYSPHLGDHFAVVREGDKLIVYYYFVDEGASPDGWQTVLTVKLAPGSTLRFP